MATTHPIETIVSDTSIHGGQPIIAGTTVLVTDVAANHVHHGLSPAELAGDFNLDLGEVHAALAYYYQHKHELDSWVHGAVPETQQLLFDL
jgi:uncharacterized protein (DUF433 family)